ncbi:MAG: phasin family protein [Sphingomonadales bacterium]|nr:phasin family protein [Sphingomonadales bacterium]MDE2569537.1 phasin family protein [Sphingomonadales bacterium]
MSEEIDTSKADAAAVKAYADAAAKIEAAPAVKTEEPVAAQVPAAKAPAKPAPANKTVTRKAPAKPPVAEPVAKAPAVKAKPAPRAAKKAAVKAPAKPVAPKLPAGKPAIKTTRKTATKSAVAAPTAARKETKIMTTTQEFTTKIQDAVKDASEKAKVFFEKGQASFADVPEFAKGNVEAVIESSKILAAGLQDMGKAYVAESKSAFETMTADVKDLAAVKSPTEFFEKQNALARKNFDAAVAATSKNSEAMLKLVNEAFQPLSTRMSLAIEKMKKAA